MDDAEAALLALGPQLQWRQEAPSLTGFKPGNSSTVPDYYAYQPVMRGRKRAATFTVLCHETQESKDGYPTEELAKAACERHHESRMQGNREGKWE